jgi:vacuolar-type H+-ATPase subunit E/Vma4
MGLEEVKNEIVQQAEVEAAKIKSTAEAEAEEIKKNAREEVNQYKNDAEKHTSILFERTEKKMVAAAQFDVQRKILRAKQDAIDMVLNSVRESIVSMKTPARKKFLSRLLADAKGEISVAKVFVNKKDAKLISGVTTKPIEIDAGLVAENKDDTISVDLTIDTLLEQIRAEHLVELSEVLFQ